MKVTKREQVLLVVLLISLLVYGFYNFVYIKQLQKVTELKASRDTYSQKWEQAKVKIASQAKRKEQYESLNSKILIETNMLFPEIEQEEVIVILDKMFKESNLEAELLDFVAVSTVKEEVDVDKTSINKLGKLVAEFNGTTKKEDSKKTDTDIDALRGSSDYKMQVTINFKGSYDELISFIQKVESFNKKIVINNININETDVSDLEGSIIIEFNGVPKFNDNDKFKWDFKEPSGKSDPFLGSYNSLQGNKDKIANENNNNEVSNNIIANNNNELNNNKIANNNDEATNNNIVNNNKEVNDQEENLVNSKAKSDFGLRANPVIPDSNTVIIGSSKDDSKQSYIYSDNKKIELVEFVFKKTGEEYFYKYKTSTKSYPENFVKSVKFIPDGKNIILDIFSQKRVSDSDLSGANIKITNETDKDVVVNILDDDKNRPRIEVIKEKGYILVNKNAYYSGK